MKWLSAGLIFVSLSTVVGLILGMIGHGLSTFAALASLLLGGLCAIAAYFETSDPKVEPGVSKNASPLWRYRNIWVWLVGVFFLMFAVRSFCWLLYIDGDQFRIQSPNNLGDLALHITYIRNFASGVSFWPDNPIYVFSKLRYPAGIDLFNALLCKVDVDLIRSLVWVGLLASAATFYAFYRWSGAFGVAGFLFNGGLVGFEFFKTLKFADYQGPKMAWKSIPLTMFVTQRGLLYAIPVGLLLLWQWREMYQGTTASQPSSDEKDGGSEAAAPRPQPALPFWIELSLYASMPLFHLHTFIALSIVLLFLFAFEVVHESKSIVDLGPSLRGGNAKWRAVLSKLPVSKRLLVLVAAALIPATFFVSLTTDHFHAGSILAWQPGWVQAVKGDDLARPFVSFWFVNFGIWLPLVLTFVGLAGWRLWQSGLQWGDKMPEEIAFLIAAMAIFLLAFFVRLAPWGWDNMKVMIWAYFIILPFLWRDLILEWAMPIRIAFCIALFGSGFVSLIGGLAVGRPGFGFANRIELDAVGDAVRELPAEARFAAFPTYNHPLLLQGRKLVLGYPGHLWTQGFDDYATTQNQLRDVMQGGQNWRENARRLRVRYIFWGREEETNYPMSTRPWERSTALVKSDKNWGAIYDLGDR